MVVGNDAGVPPEISDSELDAYSDRILLYGALRKAGAQVAHIPTVTLTIGDYSRTLSLSVDPPFEEKLREALEVAASIWAFEYSRWRMNRVAESIVAEKKGATP